MLVLTIGLLASLALGLVSCQEVREGRVDRDPLLSGRIFAENLLYERNVTSKIGCASLCLKTDQCVTFTFTPVTSADDVCRGHSARMNSSQAHDVSVGTDLYAFQKAPGPFDCNFDTDFCSWTQDSSDVFDWERHKGKTSTTKTGPTSDHTSGSGHYAFIEATVPRPPNATARLVSLKMDGSAKCLTFWYHMYGSGLGKLNVYTLSGPAQPLGTPVFTSSGPSSQSWVQANLDISSTSPVQVAIEATKGSNIKGDIAIDDISVADGVCTADTVCTGDLDCSQPNSRCRRGECTCTQGYYYSVSTKACLDSCSLGDLQDNYLAYPGGVTLDSGNGQTLLPDGSVDLDGCQQACTAAGDCLYFEYDRNMSGCALEVFNVRNKPASAWDDDYPSDRYSYYQRNCL